jgi:hypothetical protein
MSARIAGLMRCQVLAGANTAEESTVGAASVAIKDIIISRHAMQIEYGEMNWSCPF